MINYQGYEIDDSKIRGNQGKTICPKCIELGKQNYKDTCLSVNMDQQLFNCHKCGFTGYFGEIKTKEIEYTKPDTKNLTSLIDDHLIRFSNRGITQKTLSRNNISTAKGSWWAFPYYEGNEVVNIKYKSIDNEGKKRLMQSKDAKQIVYKLNDVIGQSEAIICEGEEDSLSFEEAGFLNACSVSQGAPNEKDKNIEKKLACIYNCFDIFEDIETIYLAADNDENGKRLNRELIKIFTAEKCKVIDFKDCKDANEYLCKHGKYELKKLKETAKQVKIEGIFECKDFESEILLNYREGQPKGTTTYFNHIDEYWTHRKGEVTIWTGYNNEGKSLLLKQLLLIKSKYENWKHAIFSPEEVPLNEFYTDLIESYIGMSADKSQGSYGNYMSEEQLKEGLNFVDKYFYTVYPEDDHSLDELFTKFSYLVRKHNIDTVTFDPYNQIHHKMQLGEREDLYISRFMAKLKKFAVERSVAIHLVAHQSTPIINNDQNYPKPNIYRIKGGGTFGDKADNVISVWREYRNTDPKNNEVKFLSQKIKKQKLTGVTGEAIIYYDRKSNRYTHNNRSPLENINNQSNTTFQEVENNDDLNEYKNWHEKDSEEAPF